MFSLQKLPIVVIVVLHNSATCSSGGGQSNLKDSSIVSFSDQPLAYPLNKFIREASGIADSKINPGYIWVEEDSGNPPQLYLLHHSAQTIKAVYLKGASNTDWEDIALAAGPDPSKRYLYIGEIGDNRSVHKSSAFYRLEEPLANTDTVSNFDLVRFTYEDGPRDAEAFLVDEKSKDIFIISKRDAASRVYKLSYPYSTSTMNTAVFVQTLPYNGVVSAASSLDGKGIIVKTYRALYYYVRHPNASIPQALQTSYISLGYHVEPQGEAVGFALDNSGFFTLSEMRGDSEQSLYFYKKIK